MIGHIIEIAKKLILDYQDKIEDFEKKQIYDDPKLDEILRKKGNISSFYNDIKNNREKLRDNLIELKNKCMEKEIYPFFEEYAQILIDRNSDYKTCTKNYVLEYMVLPFKI